MRNSILIAGGVLFLLGTAAPGALAQSAKTTFAVTGVECAACGDTLRDSLLKMRGVNNVRVSMEKQIAVIDYDEAFTSAPEIIAAIASTPHMAGGEKKYAAVLQLRAGVMEGRRDAKAIQTAVTGVAGV